MKKLDKENKNKKKDKGFRWFVGAGAMSVCILLLCQFFFGTEPIDDNFYKNTRINGIDVGGMSVAEAENVVLTDMLNNKNDIEITLKCKDKSWTIDGNEFEVKNNVKSEIEQISKFERDGNIFKKREIAKQIEENGKDFNVSYTCVLSNLEEKIDDVISQIEMDEKPAKLVFSPDEEDVFSVIEGNGTVRVKKDELLQKIDSELSFSKKIEIEVPIFETKNVVDVEKLKNSVGKRSEYSTGYEKSSKERKNNIKKALECFNGLIVESGQTVSFNQITGPRNTQNGYENAHIIVDGVYVDGIGGGVCQASTTLYNALLLADVDVLKVSHHALPASYVPLSLDSMVSGDYSDLVFQNNFDCPIYIKTICDDKTAKVEIYGQKLEEGEHIELKSELVKILPHNGDKVISDKKEEYSNKVLYKGEYYRLKFPKQGYESKAYKLYFKDGNLVEQKEIRHDYYPSQDGVVVEGIYDIVEGMSIPASDVKIISPQKVTASWEEKMREKLTKTQN